MRLTGTSSGTGWAPAAALYVGSNLMGRALEILAAHGPLAPFLGYLDRRLPTNLLLVAERA